MNPTGVLPQRAPQRPSERNRRKHDEGLGRVPELEHERQRRINNNDTIFNAVSQAWCLLGGGRVPRLVGRH